MFRGKVKGKNDNKWEKLEERRRKSSMAKDKILKTLIWNSLSASDWFYWFILYFFSLKQQNFSLTGNLNTLTEKKNSAGAKNKSDSKNFGREILKLTN